MEPFKCKSARNLDLTDRSILLQFVTACCSFLQICDIFCYVQPEARAVDLHGLTISATAQNFLSRNEILGKYMTNVIELDKSNAVSKSGMGRNNSMLVDPFLSFGGDGEVESMLNRFKVCCYAADCFILERGSYK